MDEFSLFYQGPLPSMTFCDFLTKGVPLVYAPAARSAVLNWLAGAGAGPVSPASQFQPPANFKLSNSNYHAFLDHAVLQFQPTI